MLPVCPACELELEIDEMDIDVGVTIGCSECGVDLRVVSLSPIELELVPAGEELWEEL